MQIWILKQLSFSLAATARSCSSVLFCFFMHCRNPADAVFVTERQKQLHRSVFTVLVDCSFALSRSLLTEEVFSPCTEGWSCAQRHALIHTQRCMQASSSSIYHTLHSQYRVLVPMTLIHKVYSFSSTLPQRLYEETHPLSRMLLCLTAACRCSLGSCLGPSHKCTHKWKLNPVRNVKMRRNWVQLHKPVMM